MAAIITRRNLIGMATALSAPLAAPGLSTGWAASLLPTARQTEGPFYPVAIPADADNDLVRVAGRASEAKGTILHLAGRVLDRDGRPVPDAVVEIWQCDYQGHYLHPGDRGPRDAGFQGFGRATADAQGGYGFRTIRPVPYSGRTPHIHFAVLAPGRTRLVTQMYLAGEAQNERDFLYRGLDPEARKSVTVALGAASAGAEPGALAATFDIVLPLG